MAFFALCHIKFYANWIVLELRQEILIWCGIFENVVNILVPRNKDLVFYKKTVRVLPSKKKKIRFENK